MSIIACTSITEADILVNNNKKQWKQCVGIFPVNYTWIIQSQHFFKIFTFQTKLISEPMFYRLSFLHKAIHSLSFFLHSSFHRGAKRGTLDKGSSVGTCTTISLITSATSRAAKRQNRWQ